MEYVDNLFKKSIELSSSKDETDILSAAIISSAIAEDIGDIIFERVSLEIDKKSINDTFRYVNCKLKKDDKTNLEASIKRLEYFEFPFKSKIMYLLKNIKDDRNTLFHGLLHLPEFGLNINVTGNNISKNTRLLLNTWEKFSQEITKIHYDGYKKQNNLSK